MAEQVWRPSPQELEQALLELGEHLAYPPTPDLTTRVQARLTAADSPSSPERVETSRPRTAMPAADEHVPVAASPRRRVAVSWARPLAYAALALLLLAVAVLAVAPEARNAVAERLGLRGVTIEHVPFVPAASPTPVPTATPTPLPTPLPTPTPPPAGASLRLGQQVALAEARQRVEFPLLLPTLPELGPPDEVWLNQLALTDHVALVYRARSDLPRAAETGVGLLLIQFRAQLEPGLFGKMLGPGTRVEQVTLNGRPAYWIEGRPHQVVYRDPSGNIRDDSIRLAGNVLLWEQSGLTLRLESALSKDEALRIAASVR